MEDCAMRYKVRRNVEDVFMMMIRTDIATC